MAIEQIPPGTYCYVGKIVCPHWRREGNWVYCDHLKIATEVATEPEPSNPHAPGYQHEPLALVWDQVKECDVNTEEPDDRE